MGTCRRFNQVADSVRARLRLACSVALSAERKDADARVLLENALVTNTLQIDEHFGPDSSAARSDISEEAKAIIRHVLPLSVKSMFIDPGYDDEDAIEELVDHLAGACKHFDS